MHLAYYRELSLFAAGVLGRGMPAVGRNWLTLKPFRGRGGENGGWNYALSKLARVCTRLLLVPMSGSRV
ncbi:hypothetical protein ALC56_08942 [Trachymyrmex septentrionalis]|uniref:Uncharacterized protein n=1 Tax=Trachymyrmex septentrionalis TaxID=34720 RepID=A0A195F9U7_9HYME|nr:hypothetical protein ALC56_08942 [Trachymyrmex septentrionalis]